MCEMKPDLNVECRQDSCIHFEGCIHPNPKIALRAGQIASVKEILGGTNVDG